MDDFLIDISIIIPCFNGGKYLPEALLSLDLIKNTKYEVIIINDGSTDFETLNLFNSLDRNKYIFIDQENKGLAAARNAGIKIAKGKYILPLDDDNKITPEYIYEGINILENNKDIDIVYSDRQDFGLINQISKIPDFDIKHLIKGNYIDACAIFRREVWEKSGGYDENLLGWEDWDFWLTAYQNGFNFFHIKKPLFFYRFKEANESLNVKCNEPKNTFKLLSYIYAKHPLIVRESLSDIGHSNDSYVNIQSEILSLKTKIDSIEKTIIWRVGSKFYRFIDKVLSIKFLFKKIKNKILFTFLSKKNRILILGPKYDAVFIYRCLNLKEEFKKDGYYFVDCFNYGDVILDKNIIEMYDLIILHRPEYKIDIIKFIKDSILKNKIVIFSTDDLVSEHSIATDLNLEKRLNKDELISFHNDIDGVRKIISLCTGILVSTPYLGKLMESFNRPIYVLPNVLNNKYIKISEKTFNKKQNLSKSNSVNIGYFSGCQYDHDQDFEIILNPLSKILDKYKNVKIQIFGYLNIDEDFKSKYKNQIEYIPFVPFYDLPYLISRVDINIAPLSKNNQKRAKSPIKFLEAGIVGVPTIASNIETYEDIIHNMDGFLCDNENDWFLTLEKLVVSPDLRNNIGESARLRILKDYTTKSVKSFVNILLNKTKN